MSEKCNYYQVKRENLYSGEPIGKLIKLGVWFYVKAKKGASHVPIKVGSRSTEIKLTVQELRAVRDCISEALDILDDREI